MTANVFFNALQAIDANGDAVSGAKVYFYDTGTSNLQTVYTDAGLGTPHPSPLVADSSGVFAPVFQSGSTDIKVNMTDASDVDLPGYPIDPVTLQSTASGASLIPFSPTPRIVATDVQAAIEEVDGEVKVIEDDRTIENSVYTTAGTTTTYTIAVTGFTAYATGNRFWVRANATNTGASTINVESVGEKDIKKYDSAGSIQALAADDFAVGSEYLLHYDGTQFVIISERYARAADSIWEAGTSIIQYGVSPANVKAAITAISTSGLVLLTSTDLSGEATADFTEFDSTKYDNYVFKLANVIPSNVGELFRIRTSTDGGSTYDSGASDYKYGISSVGETGTVSGSGSSGASYVQLNFGGIGSGAGEDGYTGTVEFNSPHLAKSTYMTAIGIYEVTGGALITPRAGGYRVSSADVDAVRFLFSTGNLESGTITMYGVVKA